MVNFGDRAKGLVVAFEAGIEQQVLARRGAASRHWRLLSAALASTSLLASGLLATALLIASLLAISGVFGA